MSNTLFVFFKNFNRNFIILTVKDRIVFKISIFLITKLNMQKVSACSKSTLTLKCYFEAKAFKVLMGMILWIVVKKCIEFYFDQIVKRFHNYSCSLITKKNSFTDRGNFLFTVEYCLALYRFLLNFAVISLTNHKL